MGIEIQNNELNKMITETSDNIRTISAKLFPLMTIAGHSIEVCQFNNYTNDIADLLESEIMYDDKKPFQATSTIDNCINSFLFNLGMCLCRCYKNVCSECSEFDCCDGSQSYNKNSKVVSIDDIKNVVPNNINTQGQSVLLPQEDYIQSLKFYCALYSEEFKSKKVQQCLTDTIDKVKQIYQENIYDIEKIIKLLHLTVGLLEVIKDEFKRNQEEDDEFL